MKNKNPQTTRLDQRVLLVLIGSALAGLLVSSYKFAHYIPCTPVVLHVHQGPLFAGDFIAFSAEGNSKRLSAVAWDFGDKTPVVTGAPVARHLFVQPGNYDIAITIDGKCTEYKTVNIVAPPPPPLPETRPLFFGPRTAVVGMRTGFRDSTSGATRWEWRFGEGNSIDATTARTSYIFKTPGAKNVILIVNGTRQGSMVVDVQPPGSSAAHIPATPGKASPGAPPHAPDLTKEQMADFLKQVAEGRKKALDLAAPVCGNLNIPVIYNGGKTTFNKLCNDLRDIKSKKIKSITVTLEMDSVTHCIRSMKVDLKKKWFLNF